MKALCSCLAACAAILLLSGAAATIGFAAGSPAAHEREARYFAVTRWDSDCSSGSSPLWWASMLPWMDEMLDSWYENLTSFVYHGFDEWNREGHRVNGDIKDSRFADEGLSWGDDFGSGNLDKVDAMMVGLHGNHNGTGGPWYGKVRVDEPGTGDCFALQSDMLLGDRDLEFLHLSSCHSMCEAHESFRHWKTSFDALHQLNGFYGISYSGESLVGDYNWFADDAFDVAISHSWLDNLFLSRSETGGQEQCPTSIVQGASDDDAVERIHNEEYDFVYSDAAGGKRYFHYYPTCNPEGHNP